MNVEEATRSMKALGQAMAGSATLTLSGAKAAYVCGDIEVDELERRVQDILDGTARREHERHRREQARIYCADFGHAWLHLMGDPVPLKCAHCGEPYAA